MILTHMFYNSFITIFLISEFCSIEYESFTLDEMKHKVFENEHQMYVIVHCFQLVSS